MSGWEFPYPSQRMPVLADNVVATSQPLASQAGLEMLRRGGNAVDAVVAAAIALTVVEPTGNGLGSDAFAIVSDGARLHGLNASGRSPAALDPARFLGRAAMPARGWDTVTVPGAVSAWVALSERFGKLGLAELAEPAIRYARDGWIVAPVTARAWARAPGTYQGLAAFADFATAFLPGGRAPRPGERFALPEQARTIEAIATTGGQAFYLGEYAERIDAAAREAGASLRADDLARHRPDWVAPLSVAFGDVDIHELPPNGQGVAALQALGILRASPALHDDPDGIDSLHWQIEAMKLAFADAHEHIADPDGMRVSPEALVDDRYLADRAALVDRHRAGDPGHGSPRPGGTVYLAAADAQGHAASYIQSNYAGFGSGIVVPGTGIALQNRGAAFSTLRDHPNQVEAAKRPFHTIIPGFATRRHGATQAPVLAFGVMGGPMQPQGHLQMVLRAVAHGQNPQAASDAPRWRVEGGTQVAVEPGFPPAALEGLAARGHRIRVDDATDASFGFGGAQLIAALGDGWLAASDHRKDGQAVGF